MPRRTGVLIVVFDFSAISDDEFHEWYDTEHIPAILRVPGFVSARRFTLVHNPNSPEPQSARPKFLTIYDMADRRATENPAFHRAGATPWSNRVRNWATRRARVMAQQITRQTRA